MFYVFHLKMKYERKNRIFLVKKYYEFKSIKQVQTAYNAEFKSKTAPSACVIKNIVSTFEKTGSVGHTPPKRRENTQKRNDAKNQLEKMVTEDCTLSTRKAASAIGVSQTFIVSILHDDFHLKAYKYQQWHKLEDHDYEKRVNFAHWFLSLPKNAKYFFICSDEAYFYLTLPINKQNNRNWSQTRPIDGIEIPLHDEKVLVWCAISAKGIYGPHFFENSVNQHNYLEMLKTFFWRRFAQISSTEKYYFQQDGATPHTANTVQNWLGDKFSEKFVNKKMWPPRSPDINPCDYFLWGHLKHRVYQPLPKTLKDLKANISREMQNITVEVLNSTFLNLEKRCKLILTAEGGHIEDK
jgi:transposase